MSHMSRREYRMKKEHGDHNAAVAKSNYARKRSDDQRNFQQARKKAEVKRQVDFSKVNSRHDYTHTKLNFWNMFADRPYVSVAIIVVAIFLIMTKLWWGLLILAILVAIGIFVIARSHHPDQVLSLEFKMKASRKLSMLRALELGGSVVIFLSTNMKQVVTVNFANAGSTDSLQVINNMLASYGGSYGQQGSYLLNLLNSVTGNQLWSTYRYATNSAQMMSSPSGRWIVMWSLLLIIAPAICVLAQFFKEPYSRNVTLITSFITMVSFIFTPVLMKRWVIAYGAENQIGPQAAANAISVGGMAYVAIACAIGVNIIALYRFIKKDNFE